MHPPRYGTAPTIDKSRNITPSGTQCGLTSCHARSMKSHDLNSAGSETLNAIGGDGAAGAGANRYAISARLAAATGSSAFLRMVVAAVTPPSFTPPTSPGTATGPYSFPPLTT